MHDLERFERYKDELNRLNRLYEALRLINQAIVHQKTKDSLFREICRIIVSYGGFILAWIGEIDPESKRVVPVAAAGEHASYLQESPMYADDRPLGRGPTGLAIRSGKPYVCNDYHHDPTTAPWRPAALRHGFGASGSFPIHVGGTVTACLGIYAAEPGYFQPREIALFKEAVGDISYAMENFETQRRNREAERELRRLAAIVESTEDAILSKDLNGVVQTWNPAAERIFGFTAAEMVGQSVSRIIPPELAGEEASLLERIRLGERIIDHETVRLRKSGERFPVSITLSPLSSEDGVVFGASKICRDITGRMRTEATLRAKDAALVAAQQLASLGSCEVDYPDDRWTCSENLYQILGIPSGTTLNTAIAVALVLPEDRPGFDRSLEDVLRERREHFTFEFRIRRQNDGAVRWIRNIGRVQFSESGALAHMEGAFQDITATKESEEALRENQELLKIFIEGTPVSLAMFDNELRYIAANQSWLDAIQQGREILGKLRYEVTPNILETWKDADRRALRGETVRVEEEPWIRPSDGATLWLRWQVCPWRTGAGAIGGIIIFFEDITNRKTAENALQEIQERYAAVAENLTEGLNTAALDGSLVTWNAAALRLYRFTDTDELSAPLRDYDRILEFQDLEGNPLPRDQWPMTQVMSGRTLSELELRARRKGQGEFRIFSYSGKIVEYSGDRQLAFLTTRDVTDRKRAEAALREAQSQLKVVVDHLEEGLVVADADGHIFMSNPALENMMGPPHPSADSSHYARYAGILDFCTLDNEVIPGNQSPMSRVLRGETLHNLELKIRRNDYPHERFISYSGTLVNYGEGRSLAFLRLQDITDRKLAEERLREAQAQLLQSQKMEAVGLLAGGIAHDFNNSLGVILGYSELLEEHLVSDPIALKYVSQILQAEERAAKLTHQLLAFSRKQLLKPVTLNLNSIVEGMQEMLHRLLGADIEMEIHCEQGLHSIRADHGQVEQVLMNLCVNARDAMPAGGSLTIRTANVTLDDAAILAYGTAGEAGLKPGDWVCLTVTDTGCGMDAPTVKRIFEPFFTTKESGKGTGLGLSTSYGIIQQSGGFFGVQSTPGQGSAFHIFFPQADPEHEAPQPTTSLQTGRGARPDHILLVDDETALRNYLAKALRARGYNVIDVATGAEAIALVRRDNPPIDLLITDVIMPGISGPQIVSELMTTHPALKVIFISGYTDDFLNRYGSFGPETTLISKPFHAEALVAAINKTMGESKHPAAAESS